LSINPDERKKKMGRYYVKTIVEFSNEVEADSEAEAEAIGWNWEDELHYDGVYSIEVEELESDEDED
jgi:hypothetical protein